MPTPPIREPLTVTPRATETTANGRATARADGAPGARVLPGSPAGTVALPVRRPSPLAGLWARKRLLIGIVVVLLVAYFGWRFYQARAAGEVTYRFATVDRGNIQQTVSATGNLSAVKTVQVGTQVSGQVSATYVDFNDRVTKGELLARIDPTLQEQTVRDAEAQLAKANAQQDRKSVV